MFLSQPKRNTLIIFVSPGNLYLALFQGYEHSLGSFSIV